MFRNIIVLSATVLWVCFMIGLFIDNTLARRLANAWVVVTIGALLYLLFK